MNKIAPYVFIVGVIGLGACSSKVSTTGSGGQSGKYSEDISFLRPKIDIDTTKKTTGKETTATERDPAKYVEARHAVNTPLDAVLDSIDRISFGNGVVEGFTIQFYSGLKREEALNVKKQLSTVLPDLDANVQYVQPNFRVRAGRYLNRLEVQRDYVKVKRHFPNAIIIPDRIPLSELGISR